MLIHDIVFHDIYPSGLLAKGALVIYSVPIVTWGAGTLEGTIRSIAMASIWTVTQDERHKKRAFSHVKIAAGCGLLTLISFIPVVGTGIGLYHIAGQAWLYREKRYALEEAQERAKKAAAGRLANALVQAENVQQLEALEQELLEETEKGIEVSLEDLANMNRDLGDSLIGRYRIYTHCFDVIDFATRMTKKTIMKTVELAGKLFDSKVLEKCVEKVAVAVKNEVSLACELVETRS